MLAIKRELGFGRMVVAEPGSNKHDILGATATPEVLRETERYNVTEGEWRSADDVVEVAEDVAADERASDEPAIFRNLSGT